MADPITSSASMLQMISDAYHQKLFDKIEVAKENDKEEKRVQSWAEKNKEKIKKETDIKLAELGDVKIKRTGEKPEKNFPQDEKTEQRLEDEKRERFEREVRAMDGDYLKDLEKDLNQRRAVYASIELNDGARLAEVRKGLGSKNVEESIAIRNSREEYQKTLERFKDAKIEELKKKGLTGEPLKKEMAELMKQFGFMELIEMNNARNDAGAELKMGGNVFKQAWGLLEKTGNWYNKLPMWKKLLFAGAGVAGGVALSTGAAASAGAGAVVTGLVGAKRLFGATMATAGTAKGLDALHQRSIGKTADKDIEKVFKEMDKIVFEGTAEENAEERYKFMRAALDIKLENVDERLKKQKMVSLCNKFIGVTAGVFLGSGMASNALGAGFGKVAEYFHHVKDAIGGTGGSFDGAILGTNVNTPLTDAMNHPDGPPTNFVQDGRMTFQDALQTHAPTESLVIEKGSSIEGTLIKFYKEHGLNFKDNGYAAHHAYRDYMHDYIENHRDELIGSGKLEEYQRMYEDGMVNVKPGTEIVIDPHTGSIVSIDGKLSHLGGHHSIINTVENGQGVGDDVSEGVTEAVQAGSRVAPDVANAAVENITPDSNFSRELNQELINDSNLRIAELDSQYAKAADVAMNNPHSLDDTFSEELAKASEHDPMIAHETMGRIDEARKEAQRHMKSLLEMSDNETFSKIGKDFFDSKTSNIRKFGGMNVIEALKDPENNLRGLSKKAKDLIIGYANNKTSSPNAGENFKQWAYRLMTLSRKS